MEQASGPPEICLTGIFSSPLGAIYYATDEDDRLCALSFHGAEVLARGVTRFHGAPTSWKTATPGAVTSVLNAYFEGDCAAIDRLDLRECGSLFERLVWAALRQIPAGRTSTYGAIAISIGRPGAARAVGLANGRNPIALVVPCHRVIGASGSLIGYGAGLCRKRWLLAHEAGEMTLL